MKISETSTYLSMEHEHDGHVLPYRVYYPKGFDHNRKYPLLLFMHGAGERGHDNTAQLIHGSELIADQMDALGGIAIFPQCATDDYWVQLLPSDSVTDGVQDLVMDTSGAGGPSFRAVVSLLQEYLDYDYIDMDRIYVAGLSMGGMATFELLWRLPDVFAAAAPICGSGSPDKALVMRKVPMRIYHGTADPVVSVRGSLNMYEALQAVGAEVDLYLYDGVGHDSWNPAFAEPDFISWMFSQSKQTSK